MQPTNTTIYLNGVAYFVTSDGFNAFSGVDAMAHLAIGGSGNSGDYFSGFIDNVRLSTFTSGTFNTSMLAYSAVPEPTTYSALLGLGVLGLAATRRRRR